MGMTVHSTIKKINTTKLREGIVRVGWFEGMRYEDGTTVAAVARFNEYGALAAGKYYIPPRPFMRPALHQHKLQLNARLRQLYSRALKDGTSTTQALEQFGEFVAELVRSQIDLTMTPANSPVTIHGGWLRTAGGVPFHVEPKRGTHPLKDTGFMQDSITYKTEEVFK